MSADARKIRFEVIEEHLKIEVSKKFYLQSLIFYSLCVKTVFTLSTIFAIFAILKQSSLSILFSSFLSIMACLYYVRGNEDKFDVVYKHLFISFRYYYYVYYYYYY